MPNNLSSTVLLPPLPAGFDAVREFPILAKWNFQNHAGVAPIAARAADALRVFAAQAAEDAYLTGRWYKQAEIVRQRAATLINASADEIAFTKNTSEGLAFVANGLDWKPGDEIIAPAVGYPANVYPWMDVAQRHGVKLVLLQEHLLPGPAGETGIISQAELLAAITPRTRMIALSHVEFSSGFRHDLAAIGQVCRQRGILLTVDGIQACGALPVDVAAMNIDFLSADGHKWMLAPEGCGIFYCRRELLESLRPEVGWMNVAHPLEFSTIDFQLNPTAKRFECGSYNVPGVLALGAALELILEVGIDTISQRILALTDRLAASLIAKGYGVYSPRGCEVNSVHGVGDPRSGIVSFYHPTLPADPIAKELEKKHIVIAVRGRGTGAHGGTGGVGHGGRLRASPHFYNTPEQIDELLAALPTV